MLEINICQVGTKFLLSEWRGYGAAIYLVLTDTSIKQQQQVALFSSFPSL